MRKGFLLRESNWSYIQYREDGTAGAELFDLQADPLQYTNLIDDPAPAERAAEFKAKLAAKLTQIRDNDFEHQHRRPTLRVR